MDPIRYFSLVEMDENGSWQPSAMPDPDDADLIGKAYLCEFLPLKFQLRSCGQMPLRTGICCPYCGKVLTRITTDRIAKPLLTCNCKERSVKDEAEK